MFSTQNVGNVTAVRCRMAARARAIWRNEEEEGSLHRSGGDAAAAAAAACTLSQDGSDPRRKMSTEKTEFLAPFPKVTSNSDQWEKSICITVY